MLRYKLLTLLIMLLGDLRDAMTTGWMALVKDSPLIKDSIPFDALSEKRGVAIICCDCGLEHRLFKDGQELKAWPLRPKGYDYSLRLDPPKSREERD